MMSPTDHSLDAEFKLKEIAYFMKHFRAQSHDDLAITIISDLNQFLKAGGDCDKIFGYLEELEAYAQNTASQNYVWELVYARRSIKSFFETKKDYVTAYENAMISAKHFDIICKLHPSHHNLCCRIAENLSAVYSIYKTKYAFLLTDQLKGIFYCCHRLFGEIEDNGSTLYYRVAFNLYLELYLFSMKQNEPQDLSYDWLSLHIDFAVKRYKKEKNHSILRNILNAYAKLSVFQKFSYESEKERISTVLAWAESAIKNGTDYLEPAYDHLKAVVRKYEDPIPPSDEVPADTSQ